MYAGREVARALAKDAVEAGECRGDLGGLSAAQRARLEEQEARFKAAYPAVGKVVPLREYTMAQLAAHDGSDPAKPILLAIRGFVYDVSTGRQFYGPQGTHRALHAQCSSSRQPPQLAAHLQPAPSPGLAC